MRTVLFTGLLGSGKSTVILKLASFLKGQDGPQSVALIEAEAGDKSLTCEFAADSAIAAEDLTRGCVGCTSLAAGLCSALEKLQSGAPPSWLLIEASTLGFQTIKDMVAQSLPDGAQPFTVLVLEAVGWADLYKEAPLMTVGLASGADLVLINSFPSVAESPVGLLSDTIAGISEANPGCLIAVAPFREMDPTKLFRIFQKAGLETGQAAQAETGRGMADERASVPSVPA
ncbi:MAG: hypothetical protein LBQ12_05650 [Deltaproteobacteria bacterium]|jgi:G3E family GTPase|nr:hypothetical protein [Deltaproteobacteria bacterium]